MSSNVCAVLIVLIKTAYSLLVDNAVTGEPEVICSGQNIQITVTTANTFQGNVFIKPRFMTKMDRAYRIECFYAEMSKQVGHRMEVGDFTTQLITKNIHMPTCVYQILRGGSTGETISVARIGDPVYHQWSCSVHDSADAFCMFVHSCEVDDGRGDKVRVIDANGCAVDQYLMGDIEYPRDLVAGQESHVFKYADRTQVFYQCQITINVKDPGTRCPRPECPKFAEFQPTAQPPSGIFRDAPREVPPPHNPPRNIPPELLREMRHEVPPEVTIESPPEVTPPILDVRVVSSATDETIDPRRYFEASPAAMRTNVPMAATEFPVVEEGFVTTGGIFPTQFATIGVFAQSALTSISAPLVNEDPNSMTEMSSDPFDASNVFMNPTSRQRRRTPAGHTMDVRAEMHTLDITDVTVDRIRCVPEGAVSILIVLSLVSIPLTLIVFVAAFLRYVRCSRKTSSLQY